MSEKNISDITVVIPTIGEKSLKKVVKSLLEGSLIPDKILICIPNEYLASTNEILTLHRSIEIIQTSRKGQVYQRSIGFSYSKTKYTLQLDSDVIVGKNLLSKLIHRMEKYDRVAVGPIILDYWTKKPRSNLSPISNGYTTSELNFLYWIANGSEGYKSGAISKSGINFGLDTFKRDQEVQWLPGGCIMHKTESLVMHDFYPYKGKAYAEDLYHSMILSKNRTKMIVASDAFVEIMFINKIHIIQFFKEQFYYNKSMLNLINIYNKSKIRFIIFRLFFLLFSLRKRIF